MTRRNLLDNLSRLDHLYDRLIGAYKAGEEVVDNQADQAITDPPADCPANRPTEHVILSPPPAPPKADEKSVATVKSKLRSYKKKS